MKFPGQIALSPFPFTNLASAKLRPVLILRQATRFDDWLVCMVTSQLDQADPAFDEFLQLSDADFSISGLKVASAFRLSRLAVINGALLAGKIGTIDAERLFRVRHRIAEWVANGKN